MGRFFNYENPVFQFLNKLVDCITLSILWMVFSLPIITVGASTTALYYVTNKVIRQNRSHVWEEFWSAFRLNFKQATLVWLFHILLSAVLGMNSYFVYLFYRAKQLPVVFLVVIVFFFVLAILWGLYLYPYISRFQNSTKEVLSNCLMICLSNLHWTILLLIIFVAAVYIFVVGFGIVAIMLVPTGYMYMNSVVLEKIFKRYMSPEDLARESMTGEANGSDEEENR